MAIAIADQLISKGMKQEDVSKVVTEMSSYYNRLHLTRNNITSCDACSLRAACKKVPIAGLGPLQPEVLVVSDHPLDNDESTGMIETSVFMMTMFSRIGLKVDDIYWTHAVKCRTDRVSWGHIKECHYHLTNEIAMLQPAVIVALGSAAISSLAGEQLSINDAIGGEFEFDSGKQMLPVIPVYHPRTLMGLSEKEFRVKSNKIWTQIKEIVDYL